MIKSITRSNRWWDLPAALLLAIVLTISFSRLLATEWTEGLRIIYIIVYVGLIAGFALGYSQFSTRRVTFFAVAYGLFVIIWQLGTLLGHRILWTERIQSLGGRLGEIIGQLYQQQAVSDNLLFLTLMAILFWALSIYAGYSFTRHGNPWRIVIPVGIVLVLIHSYDALLDSRTLSSGSSIRRWIEEGGKLLCLEMIDTIKGIEGVSGIHLMPIGWESITPTILEGAGLLPRPKV